MDKENIIIYLTLVLGMCHCHTSQDYNTTTHSSTDRHQMPLLNDGHLHLNSCRPALEEISELTFQQYEKQQILYLYLSNNKIRLITKNTFHGLQSVITLDLSYNFIRIIEDGSFKQMTNLGELFLNNNALHYLRSELFYGLNALLHLELQHNNISVIEIDIFRMLTNLKYLNLCNNKLDYLQVGLFSALTALTHLQLCNNRLIQITTDNFQMQKKLEVLNLSHNEITMVQSGAFMQIKELKIYRLNDNQLEEIFSRTFQGLGKLQSLFLQNNKIRKISKDTFIDLFDLEELNLSSNQLAELNINIKNLKKLRIFDISNNSAILDEATTTGITFTWPITTSYPMTAQSLTYEPVSGLTIILVAGLSCAAVAVIVLIITICLVRRGLQNVKNDKVEVTGYRKSKPQPILTERNTNKVPLGRQKTAPAQTLLNNNFKRNGKRTNQKTNKNSRNEQNPDPPDALSQPAYGQETSDSVRRADTDTESQTAKLNANGQTEIKVGHQNNDADRHTDKKLNNMQVLGLNSTNYDSIDNDMNIAMSQLPNQEQVEIEIPCHFPEEMYSGDQSNVQEIHANIDKGSYTNIFRPEESHEQINVKITKV